MWLALTSVVLAASIGFNVLALLLTGWFERQQAEMRYGPERNAQSDLNGRWTPHIVR